MKKFGPLVKSIVYPALAVVAHGLVEKWQPLVHALGPHFAWLGGAGAVAIASVILHQIESPTQGN